VFSRLSLRIGSRSFKAVGSDVGEDGDEGLARQGAAGHSMSGTPGFVRTSQAWYGAIALGPCAERVCIAMYGAQQPRRGELVVEWRALDERPELRVSQDGWDLLARDFSGLLRHMVRLDSACSPDDFCAMLLRLGFADRTIERKPANVEALPRLR
jgi:hypothetical protein